MNAVAGYRSQLSNVESSIMQVKTNKELADLRYHDAKQTRAQLEQLRSSSSNVNNPVVSREASPEERDLAQKIGTLSKYEANLALALNKYTENHPDVGTYRREISRLEDDIEEARAKLKPYYVVPNDNVVATPPLSKADIEQEKADKEYALQNSRYEADIAKLEREREGLQKAIDDYESRIRIAPTLEQELEDLFREEALLKKQYDSYAAQKISTGMVSAVETDRDNEVYRVIDEANFPIYPETSQSKLILMSLCGGLIAGFAAAFGRELIDSTVGSEEEAKKVFNLPVLAGIPAAPRKSKKTELRKTA